MKSDDYYNSNDFNSDVLTLNYYNKYHKKIFGSDLDSTFQYFLNNNLIIYVKLLNSFDFYN